MDCTGGDALEVDFLNDRCQRLLRHAARLEEAAEVAAETASRNVRLDGSSQRLPITGVVAVALVDPLGTAQRLGFQSQQALSGQANHLAQECRVGTLFQNGAKGDLVVGLRGGSLGSRCVSTTQLYPALPR